MGGMMLLDDLEMSVRLERLLKENKVESVDAFMDLTPGVVRSWHGAGRTTASEVTDLQDHLLNGPYGVARLLQKVKEINSLLYRGTATGGYGRRPRFKVIINNEGFLTLYRRVA